MRKASQEKKIMPFKASFIILTIFIKGTNNPPPGSKIDFTNGKTILAKKLELRFPNHWAQIAELEILYEEPDLNCEITCFCR